MARRKPKQLALAAARAKRDDLQPRDIGLNLIRVSQKYYAGLELDFLSECDVEEQTVSRDDKCGLFWVRGTTRMRELLGVNDEC